MNSYLESSRQRIVTPGKAELHNLFAVLLGEEAEPGLCGRWAKKGLNALAAMSVTDFEREGISSVKALELFTHFKLAQMFAIGYVDKSRTLYQIRSPKDVAAYLNPVETNNEERVILLLLNEINEVIEEKTLLTGEFNPFSINPRDIFNAALKTPARTIILSRTLSGKETEPNIGDIEMAKSIRKSGLDMGIDLLDYILVADGQWTSLEEKGIFELT